MAGSNQYTAGTVPTLILSVPNVSFTGPAGWFYLTNGTATTLYIGAAGVTSLNGAAIPANGTLTGFLFPGDQVYAATSGGSATFGVLQTGY